MGYTRAVSTASHRARQRQRRGEVRAQIIAAANGVLRRRPYRDLTVEEVMAATGLSRTLFYRHFDDLPDLVLRVLSEEGGELYRRERPLAESALDHPDGIRQALRGAVLAFADHGPLVRAMAEAASYDERIEDVHRELIASFTDLTASYLRDLQARGLTAVGDAHETAQALNLMNERYLIEAFGREPLVDPETALDTLTHIWAATIFGPPPSARSSRDAAA
jgi:AcrR family transcriptional regulator